MAVPDIDNPQEVDTISTQMDISKIIRDAEAETAAKEEARQKTLEEQKQEATNKLRIFTEELQAAISTVIRPVLEDGARQIQGLGYSCNIKSIETSNPDRIMSSLTIGVELFLKGKTIQSPARIGQYTLSYHGSVEKFTIGAVMNIFGANLGLPGAHALAVSQVTKPLVEEHFTKFIREVMECEARGVPHT